MRTFQVFEQALASGLPHLYDLAYQPPELLCTVIGGSRQQKPGTVSVQTIIIQAIEALKPAPDVSPNARTKRLYELLSLRYVQGLTQEETAERLQITPRHLRREQRQAVHLLARYLWEQGQGALQSAADHGGSTLQSSPIPDTDTGSISWRSQVRRELAHLQQSAPESTADVVKAIDGAVQLGHALATGRDVTWKVSVSQPNLIAAIHPSALRQVLITAIEKLIEHMKVGEIAIFAEREGEQVKITITGCSAEVDRPPHSDLMDEILTSQGGSVEVSVVEDRIVLEVGLPIGGRKVTVLVVDDNKDLVTFLQNYTTGTKYHIVPLTGGQHLFNTVKDTTPDIIVLDVMLPGVDGWELLTYLHEHPDTRSIPVIVCSVVRREELALALGAALYLPKPVGRQQFIQALDQVLSGAAATGSKSEASSATPD